MSKKRVDGSSYEAKYPYNQVMETEAGHQIHYDDTPGKERIFIGHKSGSYTEISADGKVVTYAVGDQQTYGKGGVSFTVDENMDVKIHGHQRILAGGGSHIEVAGDAAIGVGGSTTIISMGDLKAHVDNIYIGAKGNMNFNVGGNMNMKVAGATKMESGGNHDINAAKINLNS